MAVVKVIELIAESDTGWDGATHEALVQAQKSVNNIQNIYVREMKAIVEDNKITKYRVNVKVAFIVEGT